MKRFLLTILAFLVLAPTAGSYYKHNKLNEVASWIAMRPVEVFCYLDDEDEAPWTYGSWGYVDKPLGKQSYEALDFRLCEGAQNINDTNILKWQRALGVLALTHESYHLRRWGGAGDEAKVECKAIRHWRYTAQKFGATNEIIEDLWPLALALHYKLTNYVDYDKNFNQIRPYYDPNCKVPPLFIQLDDPANP